MKNIGILRHQLFKISETFIHAQVSELKKYYPIYIGREIFGEVPNGFDVFCPFNRESLRSKLEKAWYTIFKDVKVYSNFLKTKDLKLIHSYFGNDSIYGLEIARKLKIPHVTTFLGFDVTSKGSTFIKSGKPSLIRYYLEKNNLKRKGDLFLCYSNYLRDILLDIGFPQEKTLTHYVGIKPQEKIHINESLNKKYILHVGRLVEKKGTANLIKAFAKVNIKHHQAHLVIIGDGPLRKDLEKLVSDLNITNHISFLGAKSNSEVITWIKKSYIFALPSITAKNGDMEGLPFSILEAQSYGLPVVSTFHSGIPEAVFHNETGILCDENDINQLAVNLEAILKDEKVHKQLSLNAFQNIYDNFNIEKQTHLLEEYYDSL